jgi:hypothetical protein
VNRRIFDQWLKVTFALVRFDPALIETDGFNMMRCIRISRSEPAPEALKKLEGRRLLSASRGLITLRDREGLEKVAGAFYGVPEAELRRLLG